MAIYNEILAPRYARMLQKLFGMKGGAAVRQLAGEIAPNFSLFNGRENRFLEGWQLFGARFQVGAVAAQDSVVRFFNPAGSNVIGVIESLKFWFNTSPGEAFLDFAATSNPGQLSTPNTPAAFDSRGNPAGTGNNGAQCTLSGANNIGAPAFVTFDDFIIAVGNNVSPDLVQYEEQEIPVLPGAALQIRSATLNVILIVAVRWRERLLEESERTG